MLSYEAANGKFPPAYVADADGNPLYSWRVLILPHLEQMNVYEQFNRGKAWDGPENAHLSELNLPTYSCPSAPKGHDGLTHYAMITGPEALFDGTKAPSRDEIRDGPSNTILIVEMRDADIHWSEPRDITMDDLLANGINADGHPGGGSFHPGGMNAVLCDGSVHFLSNEIDLEVLRSLVTPRGGEVLDSF